MSVLQRSESEIDVLLEPNSSPVKEKEKNESKSRGKAKPEVKVRLNYIP